MEDSTEFFKINFFSKLQSLEDNLGADVFKISNNIRENTGQTKKVEKLLFLLEKNLPLEENQKVDLSDDQKNQISRILSTYSWALLIARQENAKVLSCLNQAEKHALADESKALHLYVKSSITRGYSQFADAEAAARELLEKYFVSATPGRAHALNQLGLALNRQKKFEDAQKYLQEAALIAQDAEISYGTEKIITTAEGDFLSRTKGNIAQVSSNTKQFATAYELAMSSLQKTIDEERDEEDIAYGKIVVGEALIGLGKSADGMKFFTEAEAVYNKKYSHLANYNHMRVLVDLAEAYQKLEDIVKAAQFANQATSIGQQLKYKSDHDFMKRLEILAPFLQETPQCT